MARLSIEDQFWLDVSQVATKIGDLDRAIGNAIRFFRFAQEKHHGGKIVSDVEFEENGFCPELIPLFARRVPGGVCAAGAAKHFGRKAEHGSIPKGPTHGQSNRVDPSQMKECIRVWGETLQKFKINKDPRLDEFHIARLIMGRGYEKTRLALIGARHEPSDAKYDAAKHCRITRLIEKADIFEKFENLGAQNDRRPAGDIDQIEATEIKATEEKRRAFNEASLRAIGESQ